MSEQPPVFHGALDPTQYELVDGRFVKAQHETELPEEEAAPAARSHKKIAKVALTAMLVLGMPVGSYAAGHLGGDFVVKKGIQMLHVPGLEQIDPSQDQLIHDLWGGK